MHSAEGQHAWRQSWRREKGKGMEVDRKVRYSESREGEQVVLDSLLSTEAISAYDPGVQNLKSLYQNSRPPLQPWGTLC